ncbi:helicase-related protein [Xanthobacter autotrophicus]|uniref:helicase-related protein n=1 Tax=Xanthobacter autotrophicus TaxID=280 RepID=UPI003726904C
MTDLAPYHALIASKRASFEPRGFYDVDEGSLPSWLFDHQRHGVGFALRTGCSALFYDTGLGKTGMALAWGDEIVRRTNKPVLMLAPLAVASQHIAEAERFGIDARMSRFGAAPDTPRIAVTNYDRLEKFDPLDYAGVILDESSVLKSFSGATTRKLIEAFAKTPYRLCCSATPAPNDHTELGQHSEFLGALDRSQMLVRWFLHDSADTGTWRMKGHAVTDFWNWVASWARAVSKPSDLGFSDDGFDMPELIIERHIIAADRSIDAGAEKRGKHIGQGMLFRIPDTSATSIHAEKRLTSAARAADVVRLIEAEPDEPWVIWVDTDYDADAVKALLPGICEVSGKMKIDQKEDRLAAFSRGEIKWLLTKSSIAGYGLNWQHCARMAFCGISFSYESFYQAVRRCWRFRQTRPVHVHIVCADTEAAIWDVVSRKAGDHDHMKSEMASAMRRASMKAVALSTYHPNQEARLPAWMTNAGS